jgi:hypothetical protein
MTTKAKMLHLGCGRRHHPDWDNLDFNPMREGVIMHDLTKPLPYDDNTAACCYTSHVLGHFEDGVVEAFLKEQLRVLEPGGVARFAVPDLQKFIAEYTALIGPLSEGDLTRADDYEWNQIEIYDGVNRSDYGGKMLQYLSRKPVPNREYIISRIGEEGQALMDTPPTEGNLVQTRIKISHFPYYATKIRLRLTRSMVALMAGKKAARAFQQASFRAFSGEVQHRVYDQYSLARDLTAIGFASTRTYPAHESSIKDFARFHFDTDANGTERKPESLYMEAFKPA